MFVWAEIPDQFKAMGSLEFSKYLITMQKLLYRRASVSAKAAISSSALRWWK